jgi:hypothetical protein
MVGRESLPTIYPQGNKKILFIRGNEYGKFVRGKIENGV